MNNRRLLIAGEFHFVQCSVEKDSKKHHKLTQNSVSFSCQSIEDSRCCINFPHDLTCQVLANQTIKIGLRAWPTHEHGEKSQKQLSSLPVEAGWIFASEVSLNQNFNWAAHKHNIFHMNLKKNQTWACNHLKTSTLSADNFQKIVDLEGSTPEPAIRSSDTGQRIPCFDSCQLITTLMSNMCISFPVLRSQTS